MYYNLDKINIIKILYFNRNEIHNILYNKDKQIIIDCKTSNLSFNFYLSLLLRENPDYIDYCYSFIYIKELYEQQKLNIEKKYNKMIISKMILELIDNYKEINEGDEYEFDNNEIENIEKESKNIIKDTINILKEFDINWTIDEIKQKKIDEIYSEIIKKLIIKIKFKDFEYILNIIEELDLENIDLIRKIFNEKSNLINIDENYIKDYLILKDKDLFNEIKINFYFIILKYILNNNSLFIYSFKFLIETKKVILNLINSNSNIFSSSNITNMDCNLKRRFEYILEIITDSKYYIIKYNKLKLNASKNNEILKNNIDEKCNDVDIKRNIKILNKNNKKLKNIENSSNYQLNNSTIYDKKNIVTDSYNEQESIKDIVSENELDSKDSILSINQYKNEINTKIIPNNNSIDYINKGPISRNEISCGNNVQNNNNKLKRNELYKKEIFKFIKIIGNHNKIIEDKNIIKKYSKKYTADFIKEINIGFVSAGANNEIIIYNKSFEKLYTKNFDSSINNICELKILKKYGLIVCLKNNLYFLDLNNYSLKEMNYENSKKSNFSYLLKIDESDYIICNEKEVIYYSDLFSDIVTTNKNIVKIESVESTIKINNNYSALKVCNICSKKHEIIFYKNTLKKNMDKIVRNNNGSFTYTINSLTVLPREEIKINNKILLCACKKYLKNQKNGILLVNLGFKETEINDFNYNNHFYNTGNFEVYCFCPLLIINNNKILYNNDIKIMDTDYFLVGGFNIDKKKGEIKLYKVFYGINFYENRIEYIDDIIIDNNDNLRNLRSPISSIVQDKSKEHGNILITCWDGNVYLLSSLNIEYYIKYDEKVKNNILFNELFGNK